jgi:uncharacterized protein YhaN
VIDKLNPQDVVLRLAQISRLLDACQAELAQLDEDAVRTRQRYEVAYSRAILSVEAANAESRKARATLDTEALKLDAEIADQKVRACRSRLSVLRDQVEIGRSLSAALRSEWAVTA